MTLLQSAILYGQLLVILQRMVSPRLTELPRFLWSLAAKQSTPRLSKETAADVVAVVELQLQLSPLARPVSCLSARPPALRTVAARAFRSAGSEPTVPC